MYSKATEKGRKKGEKSQKHEKMYPVSTCKTVPTVDRKQDYFERLLREDDECLNVPFTNISLIYQHRQPVFDGSVNNKSMRMRGPA